MLGDFQGCFGVSRDFERFPGISEDAWDFSGLPRDGQGFLEAFQMVLKMPRMLGLLLGFSVMPSRVQGFLNILLVDCLWRWSGRIPGRWPRS